MQSHRGVRCAVALAVLLLLALSTTRSHAQDNCTALQGGYCGESGVCAVGSSAGPATGTCTSGWTFGAGGCQTDPCTTASTCKLCAALPATQSCGWCADSQLCLSGQASGPTVGPSCSLWSFLGCSAAAQCAAIPDCSDCLLSQFDAEQCGWCATSGRCSAGDANGPFAAAAASCPNSAPNAWRWNSFESSYLPCYQQLPYTLQQPAFTTTDQMSFALLCATLLLLVFLGMGFSGCCRICHRWAPKPGEARPHEGEAIAEHADEDDPRRQFVARECGGLCCDSLNSQCAKLGLWVLHLLLLALILAAMGLDQWSVVQQQIALVSAEDNPVTTVEGTLLVSVMLGSSRRDAQSYTYDCSDPAASNIAQSECAVHYDAGVMTLILGIGAALAAFVNFLIASSDLCCSPRSQRAGAVDGAVRAGNADAIDLILAHKIKHPYSSLQWRLAVLSCIGCLIACAFWLCGSYVLSQQYLGGLQLGPSFHLMVVAWALGALLAVLYRRAIRVTPREGYPLESDALVYRRSGGVQHGEGMSRSESFGGNGYTAAGFMPLALDAGQGYGAGTGAAVDISAARLGQPTPSGGSGGSGSASAFSYQSFASQQAAGSLSQPLLASGSLSSSPQKTITRSSFRGPLSPMAQQQMQQEEQQRIAQQQQQYAFAHARSPTLHPVAPPSPSFSAYPQIAPPPMTYVPPPGFVLVPVEHAAAAAAAAAATGGPLYATAPMNTPSPRGLQRSSHRPISRPASPGMFGASPSSSLQAGPPSFTLGAPAAIAAPPPPAASSATAVGSPGSAPPTAAWSIPAQHSPRHSSSSLHRSSGTGASSLAQSAAKSDTSLRGLRGAMPPED